MAQGAVGLIPRAFRRTPRGLALAGGTASLGVFTGCELVQAFFEGAGKATTEALPEVTEDALSGNWIPATVGLIVTAIVGGTLEVGRRRRKRRARAEFLKGTPPGRKKK